MKDGSPFGIAGIWENWKEPASGEWIRTFAIITTDSNELVADIHDRMPVILAPTDYARWLCEEPDPRDLMRPFPADLMQMWPISTRVNKPENDDPSIIEPIDWRRTLRRQTRSSGRQFSTFRADSGGHVLPWSSTTLIHERHRPGPLHISFIEPLDAECGILDQFLDRAVQVTAAGQVLPGWGEMILPPAHTRLRRAPMLDEQKSTARPQYPTHLQ
jgi:hypothetical protein